MTKKGVFGVVYDPPSPGFPYLAALFNNGELLTARPVRSVAEGEALIAHVLKGFAERARSDKARATKAKKRSS